MDLGQVQATYEGALHRVMSDLTVTTGLRPNVVVDLTDPDGLPYRYQANGGSGHGAALVWDDDEESATVTLADLVQGDALEELWGPTWPTCPGHCHLAQPTLQERHATWVCPRSQSRLATIGSLGSPTEP